MLFGRAAFGCDDEAGAAISDIGPHQLDGAQLVTAGDPAGDDQDTVIELAHGFDEGHRVEAPRLSAGTCAKQHHAVNAASCRARSEEHTSELQSLMRISYAVFCL